MDERQRSALKTQHVRFTKDLILDEDLYAAIYKEKIFPDGMFDSIKAEKTPGEKVHKMLVLLEKRGPKAFDKFVNILKENYEWLAKELQDQYDKRLNSSKQGNDKSDERYVQDETKQKNLNQDHFNRCDQLQSNSKHRGLNRGFSTPTLLQNTMRQPIVPTQESVSAGFYNKDTEQFFSTPSCYNTTMTHHHHHWQHQQQEHGYITSDILMVKVKTSNDNNTELNKKQYKDACMSPIGIIESTRKVVHSLKKPNPDETVRDMESCDHWLDEMQSQTATITESNGDVQNAEFDDLYEKEDNVDEPEIVNVCFKENNEDFPTSEVFYDHSSRECTCFSNFNDQVLHHDENHICKSEEHSEANHTKVEEMRKIFKKLISITQENENKGEEDNDITLDMINCETDRLIDRLKISNDTKMIKKCLELFPEKERRQPLNICIESLIADKKELNNKLKIQEKQIDQMAFDAYNKTTVEMNKKLKEESQEKHETELTLLKTSKEKLETHVLIVEKELEEKNKENEELKANLKKMEDQMRQRMQTTSEMSTRARMQTGPGITPRPEIRPRRGTSTQRKASISQVQSPRRQSTFHTEPVTSHMQGALRKSRTDMTRARNNRR